MKSFPTLSLVLLAISVSRAVSRVVTIPVTKTRFAGSYFKGLAQANRARATPLKSCNPVSVPATDQGYTQYTARVGIGNPPTYYNLIVDTGSSNTFCGAGTPYKRTNSSIPTGEKVNTSYEVGYFTGLEYLDQVTLASNLVIKNQSISDALSSASFSGVDGILALGPVDLTLGTLSRDNNTAIPTVLNNLVSQKLIEHQMFGVYFTPSAIYTDTNGVLTFGGVDPSLYKGDLTHTPLTKTEPASQYWGINITSCTYGNHTIIPESSAGIVDTGTTQVLLSDDFFDVYVNAIPGAGYNASAGLLEIPPSSVADMKPLEFIISDRVFTLSVAAQLVPLNQGEAWDGVAGKQYGVVGNTGVDSGTGLDFILGQAFMERHYVVFDADKSRVGFAQTNYTFSP